MKPALFLQSGFLFFHPLCVAKGVDQRSVLGVSKTITLPLLHQIRSPSIRDIIK